MDVLRQNSPLATLTTISFRPIIKMPMTTAFSSPLPSVLASIFSPPGNGVSHQVHLERFGAPGKTLLGSDSHTSMGGALGMIAIGVGGLDVALALVGEPFYFQVPKILGVKLTGKLPPWVSGKDVILEMLRRHTVKGGVGRIVEYYGQGVDTLSVTDRATIANMGAELGVTTTVFPSDHRTLEFLKSQGESRCGRNARLIQTPSTMNMMKST